MFKSLQNLSCTNLFITNSPLSFQNKTVIFIGFLDHYKLLLTVMKKELENIHEKKYIRKYKQFNKQTFKNKFNSRLNGSIDLYSKF